MVLLPAPRCGRRLEGPTGVQRPTRSSSFGDAFLAAIWSLSSSAVSYHPSHVPLSMCLRSGLWEQSGTTSNLHCECVRHSAASDVQKQVSFFHGSVQEGFTVTPEVSCGSMHGTEASCIKKHVNLPPAGFLMTALIVHITSVRGNKSKLISAEPGLELVMSLSISLSSLISLLIHLSPSLSLFISSPVTALASSLLSFIFPPFFLWPLCCVHRDRHVH